MALFVLPNNKLVDGPVRPPVKTAYAMYFDNNRQVAFADTFVELMGAISPGYEVFEASMKYDIRSNLAESLALPVQSNHLLPDTHETEQAAALTTYAELLDTREYSPDAISDYLDFPAVHMLYLPCRIPEEHVEHIVKDDRLVWVCPATEESLLTSLHYWGVVRVMAANS
jgi:hypothetical protein